ncbi:MAG: hypothetical protein AVDCRST_MAG64-2794, partial [uncultured Phycisphaerae bacterium]
AQPARLARLDEPRPVPRPRAAGRFLRPRRVREVLEPGRRHRLRRAVRPRRARLGAADRGALLPPGRPVRRNPRRRVARPRRRRAGRRVAGGRDARQLHDRRDRRALKQPPVPAERHLHRRRPAPVPGRAGVDQHGQGHVGQGQAAGAGGPV